MRKKTAIFALLLFTVLLTSCAPLNPMYVEKTAGFWAGLWHGLIIFFTFVISLFTDSVTVYELNNNGNWYNFGFVLGAMISLGNGCAQSMCKKKSKTKTDEEKEWEEIGVKVEEKVRNGIKKWVDEEEDSDTEWEEIGKKVEEKIKRELRDWAEK